MVFVATGWGVRDTGLHDGECSHEECSFTLLAVWIFTREVAEGVRSFFKVIVTIESRGFQVCNIVFEVGIASRWAKCLFNFIERFLFVMKCARSQIRLHMR